MSSITQQVRIACFNPVNSILQTFYFVPCKIAVTVYLARLTLCPRGLNRTFTLYSKVKGPGTFALGMAWMA